MERTLFTQSMTMTENAKKHTHELNRLDRKLQTDTFVLRRALNTPVV